MITANIGVQTADKISTHQRDFATNLEFNKETFELVILENLSLHKQLTEALKRELQREKEFNISSSQEYLPHLKIA